jgi:hypothetical protein
VRIKEETEIIEGEVGVATAVGCAGHPVALAGAAVAHTRCMACSVCEQEGLPVRHEQQPATAAAMRLRSDLGGQRSSWATAS